MEIGLFHPGEMGAALARLMISAGHHVMWLPEGRSAETKRRAHDVGLDPVSSIDEVISQSEMIISVCPPYAAADVARKIVVAQTPFEGVFLDANAISPMTAASISAMISDHGAHYVDGGIIGNPPPQGNTRWYLSGRSAHAVAELLAAVQIEIIVIDETSTAASALKMAYASWTKATAALLLAIRTVAIHYNVEDVLLEEWRHSQPELLARSDQAARSALSKGWRWIGEMEEVASTFISANLPGGFGEAAAEIYRHILRTETTSAVGDMRTVLDELLG